MLLASSGMLPDNLCANSKSYELCARDHELCSWLVCNMPARASRMFALPNDAALPTRSRHWDDEFTVFLSDEVF